MKLEDAIKIWKVCEERTFIQINCSAKEREALRTVIERLENALRLVELQAKDEGLWFIPNFITEDHLQQALRQLHKVIEGERPPDTALAPKQFETEEGG